MPIINDEIGSIDTIRIWREGKIEKDRQTDRQTQTHRETQKVRRTDKKAERENSTFTSKGIYFLTKLDQPSFIPFALALYALSRNKLS